ncbi:simple sugar transport system permease protein [Hydrogenoanaerobacterium saccharovorans]|uniref:Monosaccharide ABC transporter membrane protein, CUT2 family n=1 Tax=Hydrogenoanaerobacterium saccharovorans TaxID=474960 RepID=A0A1H7YXR8_9FIRM|nr:ABC transporter [Hydrogenoanaerobacterium saccharovorans]RPF48947.1 simple sugar transport system permease protein [Hydrogenoanaerobacterium saccharovorans]SEM50793.1 monosaccharide ABC transporter membrane protein, CUT2 family [Hydrogenoanaerobacterium saccharovorans]
MNRIKTGIKQMGLPRLIIILFLLLLIVTAIFQQQNMGTLVSDVLVRFGMNMVLALAMVPAVMSGTGMNFGLPVGLLCGILGGLISIEVGFKGWTGILMAIAISIPFGIVAGYLYGKLLNAVKGSEMMVGTYVGYAIVSLMCIGWLIMPFKDPTMVWPIGGSGSGLRSTIALSGNYDGIFNNFFSFKIFGITIPFGLILFALIACLLMWLFSRSKIGVGMKAVGDNPRFAIASGISVNKSRIIGTVLSTVLGAIGIIFYAQSFGFYQLYNAPLNMAFAPVAAVLLGGATAKTCKISHVILGTFLFQALLTIALPVANQLMPEGSLSEVIRIIVSNGIILYALSQTGGGDNA